MKDLAQFRNDLRAQMKAAGMNQTSLASESGVDQASLSRFLKTEGPEGLSGESVLRLCPFVYPHLFSHPTPPPEQEVDG